MTECLGVSLRSPHARTRTQTCLCTQHAHAIHMQNKQSQASRTILATAHETDCGTSAVCPELRSCFPVSGSLFVQMHVYSTQLAPPTHSALLWFLSFQMFVSWILTDRKHRPLPLKICVRAALVGGKTEIQMTPASHHNTCQCRGAQS